MEDLEKIKKLKKNFKVDLNENEKEEENEQSRYNNYWTECNNDCRRITIFAQACFTMF